MRRNGYLWTTGVNLDTAVRFPDPDFLLEWKISAIRRRFPLMFAFYIWMSAIFLLPVCFTYWLRKYTTHCRLIAFLSADTSRDLVTLTFDFLTLNSCRTWRDTCPTLPPSLKTLRLFVHELRIITVHIDYHRKCVRGHCACAESRAPVSRGSKKITFWESPTPICLFTLQLPWLYDESN